VRNDGAGHADQAKEVGFEDRLGLLDRALLRASGGNTEARVVHQQVDATLPPNQFAHGVVNGFVAGDIERQHGVSLLAGGHAAPTGAVDLVARRCQAERRGLANASRSAGDECNFLLGFHVSTVRDS